MNLDAIHAGRRNFSAGATVNFANGFSAWGRLSVEGASGFNSTGAQIGLGYRW